jgi:hypothetical protein
VGGYYYFASQLPAIFYGDVPPMSSVEFRELCAALLKPSDFALVKYCTLDADVVLETVATTGCAFIDEWLARERNLRVSLAAFRSGKLHRSFSGDAPDEASRSESAAAAFAMDDPLEAELFMDKARWDAVELMAGIDYFDVNNIFSYLIKLQLLERKQLFKTEEGFSEYKALYASIMDASRSVLNVDAAVTKLE